VLPRLVGAESLKLLFALGSRPELAEARRLWTAGVASLVRAATLRHAEVFCYWQGIIEKELNDNINNLMEVLPVTAAVVSAFTVTNCL
jgi:hypothetical protein